MGRPGWEGDSAKMTRSPRKEFRCKVRPDNLKRDPYNSSFYSLLKYNSPIFTYILKQRYSQIFTNNLPCSQRNHLSSGDQ